jgi:peptide deformylase
MASGFIDLLRSITYLTEMAKRDIIILPDPRLKIVSDPVARVDDNTLNLLDDMLETMYDAPGIGLAAIQIGVPKRLIVIDIAKEDEDKAPRFFINPEIVNVSDEMAVYEEGCLSIPEIFEQVERPAQCTVRFLDRAGEPRELDCDGLLATVIQHEVDHLNGVLFIDHISRLKRDRVIRKFTKQKNKSA